MTNKESGFLGWIKKNISILLTTVTTILVAYISIQQSHRDKQEDFSHQSLKQRHDDSLFTMEYNYKKAQLIQGFMPFITSNDSATVRMALLSFYTLDPKFATETAKALNKPGALAALNTISYNLSKKAVSNLIIDKKNGNNISPGNTALINAFGELNKTKIKGPKSHELIKKYLTAVNISTEVDWSVPFVIWCFQTGQAKKLDIQTSDITFFFNELKKRKYIHSIGENVKPGDIVFFNFQENKIEQCGIVSSSDNDYIYTIEADNNGEAVSSHFRYKTDALAFARIEY